MNLDSLLTPRDADAPSGENLEYDPAFTELELAAQPGQERQMGDQMIAAEEPDWRDVRDKALAVAERTHDLRVGVFLAQAELRNRGMPGFADAVSYVHRCLTEHWETCHPQLDADDDDDPTMRVNAVLALGNLDAVLKPLRLAPLSDSRAFGRVNLRDMLVADGELPAPEDGEGLPDANTISAAFQDTDADKVAATVAAASSAATEVAAISKLFDEKTPGQGPDLEDLIKLLRQMTSRLTTMTGVAAEAGDDTGAEEVEEDAGAAPAPARGPVAPGTIASRNDVTASLDRIMVYYRNNEPSSPVPILLERAKRLVNADFLTIMKDMAPSGVESIQMIGGLAEDED